MNSKWALSRERWPLEGPDIIRRTQNIGIVSPGIVTIHRESELNFSPITNVVFHRLDRTSLRLAHSFDHLVGAGEQPWRHGETKRLSSLEVDYQLELGRVLDRQVTGFFALEDAIDIGRSSPE
jgi:hypothetical protein